MLNAFLNCLKVPELRKKVLLTFALLFVARLGANIPLPGIDAEPLQTFFASQSSSSGNLIGIYNMFTGGAFLKGAIFGLGVMPYISASIILQLMSAIFPSLARLQQEGEVGRQKLSQYGRYFTILICFIQGLLLVLALSNYPEKLFPGFSTATYGSIVVSSTSWFIFTSTFFLTAGTCLLMWIGEQITEKGIGNGISLLITVGILADLPKVLIQVAHLFYRPIGSEGIAFGWLQAIVMLVLLCVVIASMVAVTQSQRKVVVQYAKRVVGRKMYGGQSSFLPLKINYSGVMPVIFASALLMFPQQILAYLSAATGYKFFQQMAFYLSHGSATYYLLFGFLILAFSYFWVSIMFKPIQIADELKKNGGYIPGVRPGEPTAQFLDFVMTRLTFAGCIFLVAIALLPDLLYFSYNIPYSIAMFFGGTGTLITVGVILETMKQVEGFLLQHNYDGFLKKPALRSYASSGRSSYALPSEEIKSLGVLWLPLVILFVIGILAWFFNKS
jgi:preprotein translocase subunit SecY